MRCLICNVAELCLDELPPPWYSDDRKSSGELLMNNEDKILEILQKLSDNVDRLNIDMTDMKTDMADMKTRVTKIEVTQENIILPQLQLLAEGQATIQNQIRSLSVIDRLQDDVITLKAAIRYLSEKVDQLEHTV